MNKKNRMLMASSHRNALSKLLLVCLVVVALCIGISTLFYQVYKYSMIEEIKRSSAHALDRTDMLVAEAFEQMENNAYQQALATARLINTSNKNIVYDYYRQQQLTGNLLNMKNSNRYIHSVYIYFNQGGVIVTSFMGVTSFRLFYDTVWLDAYRKQAGQKLWINGRKPYDPQYEEQQDFLLKYHDDTNEVLTLLVPLSSSLQNKGGVIVVNVYKKEIAKLLGDEADNHLTLMVDSMGQTIVSAGGGGGNTKLPSPIFSSVAAAGKASGSFDFVSEEGEEFICVYARSRFGGNYIIELLPLSQAMQPATSLLQTIIVYSSVFLAVSIALTLLLVHISSQPVRLLYKELGRYIPASGSEAGISMVQASVNKIIQDNKTLTRLWENNQILIKHRTLFLLLQGKVSDFDSDPKRLEFLDIRFPHDSFACCVLHLDLPSRSDVMPDEQIEIVKMQLFSLTQQCMIPPVCGYTVDIDAWNVAVILNADDLGIGPLLHLCQRIQQITADSGFIPYTLSIGIGNCVTRMEEISLSFQQAWSAMRYIAGNCPGEIICFSSVSVTQMPLEWAGFLVENELTDAVRIGDLSTATVSLNSWFEKLRDSEFSLDFCKKLISNQLGKIVSLLPETDIAMVASAQEVTEKIMTLAALEQIQFYVTHFVEDICAQIGVQREHKNAETIRRVIDYLTQNYAHEISLTQVAESVYMSVPYLCKIFKEYTKITFNDYLTTVRMNASITLLKESTKKVKDIAASVGYNNTQSYIRAFKKYKNMTPSEFRESYISQKLQ